MESKHDVVFSLDQTDDTFNRTSVESKHSVLRDHQDRSHPFNRTSVESKRRFREGEKLTRLLLIEPVWNRNFVNLTDYDYQRMLLIEPVWNRNKSKDGSL